MATNVLNFEAQVDEWTKETTQRITAVFRQATQETVSKIQSRIPIDLGFARASVQGSLEAMPLIDPKKDNKERAAGGSGWSGDITATIVNAQLGQTIYIGWTAAYVIYLEWGHSKQAPMGFVGITAKEWPQIVERVVQRAKSRAAGP